MSAPRPARLLAAAALAATAPLGSTPAKACQDAPAQSVDPAGLAAKVDPANLRRLVDRLCSFGTRHVLSPADRPDRGIGAARRFLEEELRAISEAGGGRLLVERRPFEAEVGRARRRTLSLENLTATLPGVGPSAEKTVCILAHYDSRASGAFDGESDAPGANDDGSGTALVVEAARVLSAAPLEKTVVFLLTDGEELGLFGSRRFVEEARERGVDLYAALNFDIVGDPTGPGGREARDRIRVFSEGIPAAADEGEVARIRRLGAENDSPSRQLARFALDVHGRRGLGVLPVPIFRPDRFLRGGDHTPFLEAGVPAVRFTEVYENYERQHQDVREVDGRKVGDLPEFVDERYLADVTKLAVSLVVELAQAPSPPVVRILTAGLSHDTTLRWDPPPEEDVAGYEVLWRRTTAPDWEHVRDVGDALSVTLDLSKDDWHFAVRAYDRDGFRSPPAYPRPARE